jgi:hypothetical protein
MMHSDVRRTLFLACSMALLLGCGKHKDRANVASAPQPAVQVAAPENFESVREGWVNEGAIEAPGAEVVPVSGAVAVDVSVPGCAPGVSSMAVASGSAAIGGFSVHNIGINNGDAGKSCADQVYSLGLLQGPANVEFEFDSASVSVPSIKSGSTPARGNANLKFIPRAGAKAGNHNFVVVAYYTGANGQKMQVSANGTLNIPSAQAPQTQAACRRLGAKVALNPVSSTSIVQGGYVDYNLTVYNYDTDCNDVTSYAISYGAIPGASYGFGAASISVPSSVTGGITQFRTTTFMVVTSLSTPAITHTFPVNLTFAVDGKSYGLGANGTFTVTGGSPGNTSIPPNTNASCEPSVAVSLASFGGYGLSQKATYGVVLSNVNAACRNQSYSVYVTIGQVLLASPSLATMSLGNSGISQPLFVTISRNSAFKLPDGPVPFSVTAQLISNTAISKTTTREFIVANTPPLGGGGPQPGQQGQQPTGDPSGAGSYTTCPANIPDFDLRVNADCAGGLQVDSAQYANNKFKACACRNPLTGLLY